MISIKNLKHYYTDADGNEVRALDGVSLEIKQCFKLGRLSFFPFGKDVVLSGETTSLLLNIFWLIFGGIELAITHAVFAVILCCTIIGIPFGMQHFKLAKLALLPFGAQITDK